MNSLRIDFVSDIACPWCAVGLASLEQAIENVKDQASVEIHFQPFELNPHMGSEGEDIVEHLTHKYRITPEQVAVNQQRIAQRGAEDRAHVLLRLLVAVVERSLAFARAFVPDPVSELEVNPLVVSGGRLVALDALLRFGGAPERAAPERPLDKIAHLLAPRSISTARCWVTSSPAE